MENETKTCPYCGEEIKSMAIRCRHCQADLSGGAGFMGATPSGGVGVQGTDELQPGSMLGNKYRIGGELGRGGMAVVYRVLDTTLDRPVALKVLPRQYTFDKGFVERFIREARSAARLQHPNIITVYEAGEIGGTYFIAMALVEGETLSKRLERGTLDERETARIAGKVALALDQAHAQGLVHRDIKPSNIMMRESDGEPLLMDFGIARAGEGGRLTRTGTAMGTPEYMSPEQIEGRDVGPESDLYSLGIVMYKMLTGEEPFMGPTTSVLYRHVHEAPAPVNERNPSVSAGMTGILNKLMAKNPGERFRSGRELAAALGTPYQYAGFKAASSGVDKKTGDTGSGSETMVLTRGQRPGEASHELPPQSLTYPPAAPVPCPADINSAAASAAKKNKKASKSKIIVVLGIMMVTIVFAGWAVIHWGLKNRGGGVGSNYEKHSYKSCQGNGVYWYDSHGGANDFIKSCGGHETCSNGECVRQNLNCDQFEKQGNSLFNGNKSMALSKYEDFYNCAVGEGRNDWIERAYIRICGTKVELNHSDALSYCENALSKYPQNPNLNYSVGVEYWRNNDKLAACRHLKATRNNCSNIPESQIFICQKYDELKCWNYE